MSRARLKWNWVRRVRTAPPPRGPAFPEQDDRAKIFPELELDTATERRVYSDRFGFPQWLGRAVGS